MRLLATWNENVVASLPHGHATWKESVAVAGAVTPRGRRPKESACNINRVVFAVGIGTVTAPMVQWGSITNTKLSPIKNRW